MEGVSLVKTTVGHFKAFKKSFLFWQKELGATDYKASFRVVDLPDTFAEIEIAHSSKNCRVSFALDVSGLVDPEDFNPARHGKHEAIHLFLGRMTALAHTRFLMEREIEDTNEGMVKVLERLL